MRRKLARTAAFTSTIAALAFAACSDDHGAEALLADEQDRNIVVGKHNFDTEPIHIFARFEDFPCCQVAPGVADLSFVQVRKGERVQFSAGRRGRRFATVTCTVGDRGWESRDVDVEFHIDQSLRCVGW